MFWFIFFIQILSQPERFCQNCQDAFNELILSGKIVIVTVILFYYNNRKKIQVENNISYEDAYALFTNVLFLSFSKYVHI